MAYENQDDGLIRRYLLGQLADDERDQLEEKMMADTEFFNAVLLAEDEMVEEYVQGDLPDRDRPGFEASFLSTPQGRQQVAYAKALSKHLELSRSAVAPVRVGEQTVAKEPVVKEPPLGSKVVWWKRPAFVPYFRIAAAAVVVLGVGLGIWRVFFYQSEVSKGITALAYAYRDQRPLEARISGFNYAPAVTTRGGEPKVDRTARNLAESVLLDAVLTHPNAATHHAAGRLYLAEKKFDEAIEQFEEALRADPNSAQVHADYGAALLEEGKATRDAGEGAKSLEAFARALEHLNRALGLDGSLLEALFNRALCRQELKLSQSAREDWRTYIEKDGNSKWANEAREKLKDLEEQEQKKGSQAKHELFRDFIRAYQLRDDEMAWKAFSQARSRTGNEITETLLDSYLSAVPPQQSPNQNYYLRAVAYAGDLEYQRTSDRFTTNLLRVYQTVSPQQKRAISEAHSLLKIARVEYDRDEYEQTVELYRKATALFRQAGDLCEADIAELWTGIAGLRIDPEKSLRILERISETFKGKDYKYLLAQALSGRADAENSRRSFSKALDLGQQAYDLSKNINDSSGMLRNLQAPVAIYQRFGDYRRSLGYVAQAFDLAGSVQAQPHEIWPIFHQTAFDLCALQLFDAAVDFQREANQLAVVSGLPLLKSRSYAQLASIFERLGDRDEAIKNGELALAEAHQITSKKSQDNVIANSVLNLAHFYRERGELSRAIDYYDQAMEIHRRLNIETYMFEAHRGKLLALIGLNDDRAATGELKNAIEVIEQYRPKILDETDRNGFFDIAQSVYDIATDFSYSRMHDDQEAFRYAELSHARSLLEQLNTTTKRSQAKDSKLQPKNNSLPLPLPELRRLLPEHTQILEFSVLDDKLLTWVISKEDAECRETRLDIGALNARIGHYLDLIAKHDQDPDREIAVASKGLYETLIGPVDPLLDTESYLCIVPDKRLAYLPFGALISPVSARYFVEDHCFGLAASANTFLASLQHAAERESVGNEVLLAVGNPSFDHILFADLPAAGKEVKDIGSLYSSSLVLCDGAATERRVKTEMPKADVIHIATHYIVDGQSPMRSKLLLARETKTAAPGEDGFLEASEIYEIRLPRTRLVVLSACQTGLERSYQGEGAISIARPFLKAGVPLVVASLWPVDSESTSHLMKRFHEHRKQDVLSTAEALRRAQLDMISGTHERNRHPYYWASFAVIGGSAPF